MDSEKLLPDQAVVPCKYAHVWILQGQSARPVVAPTIEPGKGQGKRTMQDRPRLC